MNKTTTPLSPKDFIRGFTFEVRTKKDPEKWERISIHKNCEPELIADLVKTFHQSPEMFRKAS